MNAPTSGLAGSLAIAARYRCLVLAVIACAVRDTRSRNPHRRAAALLWLRHPATVQLAESVDLDLIALMEARYDREPA